MRSMGKKEKRKRKNKRDILALSLVDLPIETREHGSPWLVHHIDMILMTRYTHISAVMVKKNDGGAI